MKTSFHQIYGSTKRKLVANNPKYTPQTTTEWNGRKYYDVRFHKDKVHYQDLAGHVFIRDNNGRFDEII